MIAAATGLITSALPLPPLTLAMMMGVQIVERLIKGATVVIGKKKTVMSVAHFTLAGLAKILLKVVIALVEGLLPV